MNYFKRISCLVLAGIIGLSSTVAVKAESNDEKLNNMQQQLQQNDAEMQKKEQEKQAVSKEIKGIENELHNLNNTIAKNKEDQAAIQRKIDETHKQIEQKKQEIVVLEDKVLARKDIMRKRMVSVQNSSNTSLVVEVVVESKNFADFLQRMNAVSTILEADKEILRLQEQDLRQIEEDKKTIDEKEASLVVDKQKLAKAQAELQDNLKKRQDNLQTVQAKYNEVASQLNLAAEEKAKIESNMKTVQETIAREQEAARIAAEERAKAEAAAKAEQEALAKAQAEIAEKQKQEKASKPAEPVANNNSKVEPAQPEPSSKPTAGGKEIYVEATAYTADPGENGYAPGQQVFSAWGPGGKGYNLTANPGMKLIAVDPNVIPLGKTVNVEGYGVAIAADTGGAIKGHRIDVLMPDKGSSSSWGRRTVKVTILN
ncbi:TPA: 3D domain-containing protein [Bacillus thuringiensis]|uniref:Cell wall-binding protein n=3 Tax=Bacillus cereus group TaxID=86661 RepID=A0A9X6KXJ1_BACTU|nr:MULTISPECIES: 3D domain-containing protein [Bacillus cereus group]AGE76397.1 3D domain protein [Bacillus thuringiensis serovar kurstaki str. HD73]AHZ49565.1 cell wall-binding protein [Bacillus thuringiensis serovar kurstaki str. YBT-1520]AIE31931.1 cell wall-binding protein [Bacillus thuringiensis serovar kurstaki str. HD-1]AIM33856.1 3D domain protein [Bacillus thuringiensis serovar kurstaki str. YBT-1520]AJA17956.1 cell wall-binding protein [Bacillus thuringiensis serovar galleriae]